MTANNRQRHAPASLTVQVMQAELQVLHCRRLVGVRASMLGQSIRSRLTSPAMLLLAGALGFAAGHFTKRQASRPSNTKRPRGSHNKLFGRALKLIAFARVLSRAIPLAAKDPSVQSGLSSQRPRRDIARQQPDERIMDKTSRWTPYPFQFQRK
jgi:hypothetical protein